MTTPYDTIKSAVLGNPVDPNKRPSRTGTVKAFAEMQTQLEAAQAGAYVKDTKAHLDLLVAAPISAMAWVVSDTLSNSGIYENTGTAIAAVWTRRTDLPQFVVSGINIGSGTPNAIVATTDRAIPSVDGRCLIMLPIVANNTISPVSIAFNGGAAIPIVSNNGNDIVIGGLTNGMVIAGYIAGGKFRLLSDQATAAIQAAAEAAAAAAEDDADRAEAALADFYAEINSRFAIKLQTVTVDAQTVYTLTTSVPAVNGHLHVNTYVGGVLQPKDGASYTITGSGTQITLSENPGADRTLYVEGAGVYSSSTIDTSYASSVDNDTVVLGGVGSVKDVLQYLNDTKLSLTGGTMSGEIIMPNSVAYQGKAAGGAVHDLLEISGTDIALIGAPALVARLQGSDPRPQYNGAGTIALTADIANMAEMSDLTGLVKRQAGTTLALTGIIAATGTDIVVPANCVQIDLVMQRVALTPGGSSNWGFRLGDAGGVKIVGYEQTHSYFRNGDVLSVSSAGTWFPIGASGTATEFWTGECCFKLAGAPDFRWSYSSIIGQTETTPDVRAQRVSSGTQTLTSELTTLQLWGAASNAFTNGSITPVFHIVL